jgi:hypothetical protein
MDERPSISFVLKVGAAILLLVAVDLVLFDMAIGDFPFREFLDCLPKVVIQVAAVMSSAAFVLLIVRWLNRRPNPPSDFP